MSKDIRLWITIGILGLVILFTLQNIATVEITFLFWTMTLPRVVFLIIVFALGVLLGWVLKSLNRHAHRYD